MLDASAVGNKLEFERVVRSSAASNVVECRIKHVLAKQVVVAALKAEIHEVCVYVSRSRSRAERSVLMQRHPDRRKSPRNIRDLEQNILLREIVQQDERIRVIGE